MMQHRQIKVVVTGPESTGKTTLSKALAEKLKADFYPETAREYMENLKRPYIFDDVLKVAEIQKVAIENASQSANQLIIFDTHMIITRVWFEVVYHQCPKWIISFSENLDVDLFLICNTDIPWVPDEVRENGGEKREWLLKRYIELIGKLGYRHEIISGNFSNRMKKSISAIDKLMRNER